MGPLRHQPLGIAVRRVTEPPRRIDDLFARLFPHIGIAVERARNRGDRNLEFGRQILDRHVLAGGAAPLARAAGGGGHRLVFGLL